MASNTMASNTMASNPMASNPMASNAMASNADELATDQIEEQAAAPETSGDYPKVEAGSGLAAEAAPIGSIPLSVSEGDLPHHRAADPATIGEQEGSEAGA